jgi:glycosyltransferase involved in cell wall biosynthesis
MAENHLVTVVIPTRNRPLLVLRAVGTALNQTYSTLEVVVVIDGPDDDTVEALRGVTDPRLRFVALSENVGGSEARNVGVRESRGDWIAFLDDDDEWLPEKIAKQMAAIDSLTNKHTFLSCKFIERSHGQTRTYPVRLPRPGETIDGYMCCPRGFRAHGEYLQTSTLIVPRSLMMDVPFVRGLKRGQEFVWLIEAGTRGGAAFHVLPETLSFFNAAGFTDEMRVSSKPNWRSLYSCLKGRQHLFDPESYRYCIATRILTDAITCDEPFMVKLRLLQECMSTGVPSAKCLLTFLYIWIIPPLTRLRLGEMLRSLQRLGAAGKRSPIEA